MISLFQIGLDLLDVHNNAHKIYIRHVKLKPEDI